MIKLNYPSFWQKINLITIILLPFSLLYLLFAFIRNFFTTKIYLPYKVICVGNITIGGTGKTQLVIWITKILKQENIDFLILTKGYLGKSADPVHVNNQYHTVLDVGDEAILLSQFGDVIASKNYKKAIPLIKKLNKGVIIMDDGMQNPSLHKDCVLVTVDTMRMNGNGFIFPSGPLRQTFNSASKYIDAVIFVGNNIVKDDDHLVQMIRKNNIPLFYSYIKPTTKIDLKKKYIAFSAIGNPDKFFSLLNLQNAFIFDKRSFPDHYQYTKNDVEKLINDAINNKCELLTTSKDFIKIYPLIEKNHTKLVHNVNVELSIKNAEILKNILKSTLT